MSDIMKQNSNTYTLGLFMSYGMSFERNVSIASLPLGASLPKHDEIAYDAPGITR